MMPHDQITLQLTPDEALVFFDFLSRCCDEGSLTIQDPAELMVLGRLYASVERPLNAQYDSNYTALLQAARDRVRDQKGSTD